MAINLNRWLRKTPQPVAVLADDKRVEVPKHGRGWRDLTQTIEALEASKLVALDGQGNVIRSIVLEGDDGKEVAPSQEMSDVQLFAKLISEAYEKSGRQYEPLINNAMEMADRQGQRIARLETDLERARMQIHKLTAQIIELTSGPVEDSEQGVLGALVQGVMQGAAESKVAPIKQAVKQGAKP